MYTQLLFLVCIAGYCVPVFGYPNGAISDSCDTMLPRHGNNILQTSTPPYNISVSRTTFSPGDVITVTIQSSSSGFKGFLLQARSVGGNRIVGSFTSTNGNSQQLNCGQPNTALSHTNNNIKTSITANWTAPTGVGPLRFRATVLSSYSTFWQVESDILIALQISNDACGSEKFCLSSPANCSPNNTNCMFMSSVPSADGYVFEMSGPTSGYLAIGFSDDQLMGNDDVYLCTVNSSGNILVQRAFNTGRSSPTILTTYTSASVVTRSVNGILQCSLITQTSISTQTRATAGSSYYVFLANGDSQENGQILKHATRPIISNTRVDLSSFLSSGIQIGGNRVILAHGALMLVAWMTTGTIGMIMARYMKSAAGKPFLGKALWFQVHLFLMILTVILTIIAFIMVFVEVSGWVNGAHPVLGCIVMILSFIQPIAAFFRPDPKSERRFIFNWGHSINALVIKVLSVATIFLGLQLIDTSPTLWLSKVMGGFFAWEVLFYIILETNMRIKTKVKENSENKIASETIAVVVFICGNLAFLISLLVGIGSS
ncbi:putative ferric-chelate reductase 1 isoform X2 [Spea bombifrons]|uniref:putative ferric-chelate reductase 1 isoform X2 n=1 Tax=Spea bombifrons TaxID=233779 RepID=UPI00234B0647|nr:putative ferric-chelate reductase 1 isoform X2 [Spea bombifrons]